MYGPEEDGYLVPGYVQATHQDQQGEDELEESVGRGQADLGVDIDGVEIGAVHHSQPGPGKEQQKVSAVQTVSLLVVIAKREPDLWLKWPTQYPANMQ